MADPRRELALMRVSPREAFRGALPAGNMTGFAYVAALDATPGGPTVQPVFVGRVEAVSDDLWPGVLWVLGRTSQAEAGSLLFSIDGRLIGLITRHALGFVVVPAETLDAVVAELMRPPAVPPTTTP
jgi:hypothetical protein